MFTGLIEAMGKVVSVSREGDGLRLRVDVGDLAGDVALGDSLAVNGACLTVVQIDGSTLTFDVSPETRDRTTLGGLRQGERVNLERALRMGDRIGGHFVAGHVDGTGALKSVQQTAGQWTMWFRAGREQTALMIPKGSVAVDGISLTLVDVTDEGFSVAVIPHTFEHTTLGNRRPGHLVNIETDMLAKMVFKAIGRLPSGGISEEFLKEHGY